MDSTAAFFQQQRLQYHPKQKATRRIARVTSPLASSSIPSLDEGDDQIQRFEVDLEPKVYPQRWVQLGYLSALALLSDWICFSVAASPSTYESAYPGHSAASLIDIFLFTNVASCFLVTDIVGKFGLEKSIKGAAGLMAFGCILRSGLGFIQPLAHAIAAAFAATGDHAVAAATATATATTASSSGLVPYAAIVAGTIAVGAAQPFFQCTPPMLSATWFASDERATSTAVALNFNQIGIATAFLVGGGMATSATGLAHYFALITIMCLLVSAGAFFQFQDSPPTPPSSSEIEKILRNEEEPSFLESVQKCFQTPGFTKPLIAFICSISITNVVGAFIDDVMNRGGITDQLSIDMAGAGFELAILLGGIFIGGYVDRTKQYKSVTMACILATIFVLFPLGLTHHGASAAAAAGNPSHILLILALLGLGAAAGPIQPINAELAVDVTYPTDETAIESIQQIGGNLVSALLVPLAEMASNKDYSFWNKVPEMAFDIRGDTILLVALAMSTFAYFQAFDAPLKRSAADGCANEDDNDDECVVPDVYMPQAVVPVSVYNQTIPRTPY